MFKLGKLLFGMAVAGVTAATVYNYLEENAAKKDDEFEDEFDDSEVKEEEDPTERLKTAATRTYTTIKTGSEEAMAKVREAIGPKGEEVLDVVGETAGKVKDAVVDSAARVKDILQDGEEKIDEEVVEEAAAKAVAQEMADENDPVFVDWEPEATEAVHEDDMSKEAVYEGEENGEAIHEDDHDKEAVYEEEVGAEEDSKEE